MGPLNGPGPYTVFAPHDLAWENYLAGRRMTKQEFIKHPNMVRVLKYHLMPGSWCAQDPNMPQSKIPKPATQFTTSFLDNTMLGSGTHIGSIQVCGSFFHCSHPSPTPLTHTHDTHDMTTCS